MRQVLRDRCGATAKPAGSREEKNGNACPCSSRDRVWWETKTRPGGLTGRYAEREP